MSQLHSAEQTTREDLAAAYRLIALDGLDDGIDTHISARLPGERFLLNAYGLRFSEVRPESLVTVDAEGNVLDDPTGLGINPAGFVIHSALHAARPDVHCVLHTHTVAGVALSSLEEGLLPLNQWSLEFYNRLAYHDFEGIALSLDERERLVSDLGEHSAMVLPTMAAATSRPSSPNSMPTPTPTCCVCLSSSASAPTSRAPLSAPSARMTWTWRPWPASG